VPSYLQSAVYRFLYVHVYIYNVYIYISNVYISLYMPISERNHRYVVATMSRMLKNIGLFCKRDLQKRPIFCKEIYIFKHPTNRSHPISESMMTMHTYTGIGVSIEINTSLSLYDCVRFKSIQMHIYISLCMTVCDLNICIYRMYIMEPISTYIDLNV